MSSPILVHIPLASLSEALQETAQHLDELADDTLNREFLVSALFQTTQGHALPPNGSLIVVTGPQCAFAKRYATYHPVGDMMFAIGFFIHQEGASWTVMLFEADDGSSLPPSDLYAGPGTPFAVDAWVPLKADLAKLDQQKEPDGKVRSWYDLDLVRVNLSTIPDFEVTHPNAKEGEEVGTFIDPKTGTQWRVINEGVEPFSFEGHADSEYFPTEHLCTIRGNALVVWW